MDRVNMTPSRSSEGCDQRAHSIIELVSLILSKIIEANRVNLQSTKTTQPHLFVKFQSSYEPNVSVPSYLDRIYRYSKCSDSCFILMLVYVDRMIEKQSLILTNLNVHRILITSMMLAAKYHDDLFYNNAYFSKLGGLAVSELNSLELEMLNILDYELFVSNKLFEKYYVQLRNYTSFLKTDIGSTMLNLNGVAGNSGCNNAFQFSAHYYQQHSGRFETAASDHLTDTSQVSVCNICKHCSGCEKQSTPALAHQVPVNMRLCYCNNLFVHNTQPNYTLSGYTDTVVDLTPSRLQYLSYFPSESKCLVFPHKVPPFNARLNNSQCVFSNNIGYAAIASHIIENSFEVSENVCNKNSFAPSAKKRSYDFTQLIPNSNIVNGAAWNSNNQGLFGEVNGSRIAVLN